MQGGRGEEGKREGMQDRLSGTRMHTHADLREGSQASKPRPIAPQADGEGD